ncbi:MAG TPA: hypothetical protein VF532_10770 [Candidatus Angelobacter sp.]
MAGVLAVQLGLVGMLMGLVLLVRPMAFLRIGTRRRAGLALGASILICMIGVNLPASETKTGSPKTELDRFVPAWQFREFHAIRIAAPKEQVYGALKKVTADEIFLFRTLVWLRRLGRSSPPSILNPPPDQPLLEVASRTSFVLLAEKPNDEVVLGTLVASPPGWRPSGQATPEAYQKLAGSRPAGFAFAAMNFRLEECEGAAKPTPCTLLTTETRVYATDDSSRRRFARYWRVIYPGSAFIRRMWLRAIRRRAVQ